MLLPDTRIERLGGVLDDRLKRLDQVFLRPNLLFGVSDAKRVIQVSVESDFAAPPQGYGWGAKVVRDAPIRTARPPRGRV